MTCAGCSNTQFNLKLSPVGQQPAGYNYQADDILRSSYETVSVYYRFTNCSSQSIFLPDLLILSYPYQVTKILDLSIIPQFLAPGQSFSFSAAQTLASHPYQLTNTIIIFEAEADGTYTQISCPLSINVTTGQPSVNNNQSN